MLFDLPMRLLQIFVMKLLISYICGNGLCSINKSEIKCLPCSTICPKNKECGDYFRCPKQCELSNSPTCQHVCTWQCQNQMCEYEEDGGLKCSQGCLEGLTGKYCQEKCPTICKSCQQFSLKCILCEEGLRGENCSEHDAIHDPRTHEDKRHKDITDISQSTLYWNTESQTTVFPYGDNETSPSRTDTSSRGGSAILIVGILAALILTTIVIIVAYKLTQRRKQRMSEVAQSGRRHIDNTADRESESYHPYDDINDGSSAVYYSSLRKQRVSNPRYDIIRSSRKEERNAVPSVAYDRYLTLYG